MELPCARYVCHFGHFISADNDATNYGDVIMILGGAQHVL